MKGGSRGGDRERLATRKNKRGKGDGGIERERGGGGEMERRGGRSRDI